MSKSYVGDKKVATPQQEKKKEYPTQVTGQATGQQSQQSQQKITKQGSITLEDNGQLEQLVSKLIAPLNESIKQQNTKILMLEMDNKKQKELNKEIEAKVTNAELEIQNMKENYIQILFQLKQREEEIKNLKEQNKPQQPESQKVDETQFIEMIKQAIECTDNVAKTVEQQQKTVNQVVNDSKKLQENNQSFKDQIIQKINLFHDALNQNLVAATEDMKQQLNNIGLQVQQQQAQFMASSQSFSQWLTQLQTSVNTPSQNQQIPVQQPLYHTQQVPYDNYQQQPNYGHQNDYSQQSQILQSQQYVQPQQQIQQPPPTSTLSEVTRSKIKIVSQNNVPVQYGQ